jgi:TP901 family phage tail tape measure protein
MAIQLGDAVIRITGDLSEFNTSLNQAQASAQKSFGAVAMGARQVGVAFTAVGVAGVGAFALAAKEGIKFEASLADVRKVTDFTEEGFAEFTEQIRELATETPIAIGELLAIATVGGKFNIAEESLLKYTETMSQLVVVTDLTSQAATTMTAQLKAITGTSDEDISKLANTVNSLGQNSKTTEELILSLGLRISSAGTLAGFSEAEIIGLSAAVSAMGVRSESGGTQISKMIRTINTLAIQGAKDIDTFATESQKLEEGSRAAQKLEEQFLKSQEGIKSFSDLSNVSVQQFLDDWKEKPAEALESVVLGLQKVFKSGGDVSSALIELGFEQDRMQDVFGRTTLAAGDMAKSLDLARESYVDVGSVQEEFAIQVETTESKMVLLDNAIADFKIEIFENLKPALKDTLDSLKDITLWIGNWAKEHTELTRILSKSVIVMSVLALGIGAIGLAASAVLVPMASFKLAMGGAAATGAAAGVAGSATAAAGGVKLAALALTESGGLTGALESGALAALKVGGKFAWMTKLLRVGGLIGAVIWMTDSLWDLWSAHKDLNEMQQKTIDTQKRGKAIGDKVIDNMVDQGAEFNDLTRTLLLGANKQHVAQKVGLVLIERQEKGLDLMGKEAISAYEDAAVAANEFKDNQKTVTTEVTGFWSNMAKAISNIAKKIWDSLFSIDTAQMPMAPAPQGNFLQSANVAAEELGDSTSNTSAAGVSGGTQNSANFTAPLIVVENVNASNESDVRELLNQMGQTVRNSLSNAGFQVGTLA